MITNQQNDRLFHATTILFAIIFLPVTILIAIIYGILTLWDKRGNK